MLKKMEAAEAWRGRRASCCLVKYLLSWHIDWGPYLWPFLTFVKLGCAIMLSIEISLPGCTLRMIHWRRNKVFPRRNMVLSFPMLLFGELRSTDRSNASLGDSHRLWMALRHTAFYFHSEVDKLGMEMPSGLCGWHAHTCCHQDVAKISFSLHETKVNVT